MRSRVFIPVLVLLLPAGALIAGTPDRLADHVVLISLDGLRPEFYLDSSWPAPMLQQMYREGAHARAVRSVFPSVTYPAHTTMITGTPPAEHGIYYNSPFEPGGETGRWFWEEEHIRVPTLWDAARDAGMKTASIFWPVSVGAPVDWNVPEIWPLDWEVDEFTDPMRRLATPPGLVEELEREATGRLSSTNFSFGRLNLDDKSSEMAAYLLATHKPNLLNLHLLAVDGTQHDDGRDASRLPLALSALDRAIARLVEAADQAGILSRTTFLIVGDHGFIDLHTEVAPNVWLVEAGLRAATRDRGGWRATVHNTSVAGFVFLAEGDDTATLDRVRDVLDSQPVEIRSLFRVLERDDLDRLQGASDAALGLTPIPGVYISSRPVPPAIRSVDGASHGYLPDLPQIYTGFVAWGAGIEPGVSLPMIELEQVAPLVAQLLGMELETARATLPQGLLSTAQSGTIPP
jgi:predicted AlkP superfamily pyrophosphatase or phosphodiesterase